MGHVADPIRDAALISALQDVKLLREMARAVIEKRSGPFAGLGWTYAILNDNYRDELLSRIEELFGEARSAEGAVHRK